MTVTVRFWTIVGAMGAMLVVGVSAQPHDAPPLLLNFLTAKDLMMFGLFLFNVGMWWQQGRTMQIDIDKLNGWRESMAQVYMPRETLEAKLIHIESVLHDIKAGCLVHQRTVLQVPPSPIVPRV